MPSVKRIRRKFARAAAGDAPISPVALTPLFTTRTANHASLRPRGYSCRWKNSNYSTGKAVIGIKSSNLRTTTWADKSGNADDRVGSVAGASNSHKEDWNNRASSLNWTHCK